MNIGTQLEAPNGYRDMKCDVVYHFLANDFELDRAIFVVFSETPEHRPKRCLGIVGAEGSIAKRPSQAERLRSYRAELIYMSSYSFEQGLRDKSIVPCLVQQELPPWFQGMTLAQIRSYEQKNQRKRKSHEERIDNMLLLMAPLIADLKRVLSDEQPDRYINAFAKACKPKQNETRFRTALLAYLCYGSTRWALHYAVHRIGKWDRINRPSMLGRPKRRSGAQHGHSMNDPMLVQLMIQGYEKHRGYGRHMTKIYRLTMTNEFGCVVRQDARGKKHFVNLEGKPFPTFDQFYYRIKIAFPLEVRQVDKYGAHRVRDLLRPSQGKFQESVGNVMERVEQDAYFSDKAAKGYTANTHLPRLVVVRARDMATGMVLGIGFSVGGETAAAYRMANFCAAVDKVKFCQLFGFAIAPEQWPSVGIWPAVVNDRGPGSTSKAFPSDELEQPLIKEITPGHSGQSKANVETLHPKAVHIQGGQHFIETTQTIPQLAVQEIVRVLADNDATNVTSRLNNSALEAGCAPTPNSLWRYLTACGRTMGINIRFEDAVRRYLTPIELQVRDDGVYYQGVRFNSEALRNSELLRDAHRGGRFSIKGYVLDVCVRHLWVDLFSDLIEVDAQLAIRSDNEELYLSVAELEQLQKLRLDGQRDSIEHGLASRAGFEADYKSHTGLSFDDGHYKKGRVKRNKVSGREEARETVRLLRAVGDRR